MLPVLHNKALLQGISNGKKISIMIHDRIVKYYFKVSMINKNKKNHYSSVYSINYFQTKCITYMYKL